jgi:hypothetical protein
MKKEKGAAEDPEYKPEDKDVLDKLKIYVDTEMKKHKKKVLKKDVKESDYNRMLYNLMKGILFNYLGIYLTILKMILNIIFFFTFLICSL